MRSHHKRLPRPRVSATSQNPPDSVDGSVLIHWCEEDSRHAISSDITNGFFGQRASAAGQALKRQQSKSAVVVAGGGSGRDEPHGRGPDRWHGSSDAARLGSSLQ